MNKKYLILVSVVVLLLSTILSGCGVKTSVPIPLDETQKVVYARKSKINMAHAYQEMVKNAIAEYYVKNGTLPQKSDIDEEIGGSLDSIKISVTNNDDGTVTIKNTNQELTNTEVPDLIYNPKE